MKEYIYNNTKDFRFEKVLHQGTINYHRQHAILARRSSKRKKKGEKLVVSDKRFSNLHKLVRVAT